MEECEEGNDVGRFVGGMTIARLPVICVISNDVHMI
jgi:hypothetical protein